MEGSSIPKIRLTGRVLIVGGPYSNLEATEALAGRASALGIAPDHVVCTGDVVAYGADPQATVDLIRSRGWHVVRGNCEESLAAGSSDCGCGFPAGSACERLSAAWYGYAAAHLDSDALIWMSTLPRRIDLELGSHRLAIVHGGVGAINQFVFASSEWTIKSDQLERAGCDGVVGGHCGLPFSQSIGGRLWHNVGVIGMPANDGTPRGWYSLLEEDEDGLRIEHRALQYDFRAAATKMRRSGLPHEYADALETGLWPNCDVLLADEMRNRGRPIEEGGVRWSGQAKAGRRWQDGAVQLWPDDKRPRGALSIGMHHAEAK